MQDSSFNRTVASTRRASLRPRRTEPESLQPETTRRATRRRSRSEPEGHGGRPEAPSRLPIWLSCFAAARARALCRFCRKGLRVNRRSSPPTPNTGRAFTRKADWRACRFASAASKCSWARRSPTFAGLSTKSQIDPSPNTSRYGMNPRKNCCFDGENPASAAQTGITADLHRGDSGVVISSDRSSYMIDKVCMTDKVISSGPVMSTWPDPLRNRTRSGAAFGQRSWATPVESQERLFVRGVEFTYNSRGVAG